VRGQRGPARTGEVTKAAGYSCYNARGKPGHYARSEP
jgi:hypothetical protein